MLVGYIEEEVKVDSVQISILMDKYEYHIQHRPDNTNFVYYTDEIQCKYV